MTPRAPLLTAEMADAALHYIRNASALQIPIPVPAAHLDMPVALQALADGRTAVAPVLSEEECRAEFEALHADMVFVGDGMREFAYRWWLASRRALGLVKP